MIKPNQQRLYEYDFNVNNKNKSINLKMRKGSNRWTAAFKPPPKYAHHWGFVQTFSTGQENTCLKLPTLVRHESNENVVRTQMWIRLQSGV